MEKGPSIAYISTQGDGVGQTSSTFLFVYDV